MNLDSQQESTLLAAVQSHRLLVAAAQDLFGWFQTAVAGYSADAEFQTKLDELQSLMAREPELPGCLDNHWQAFTAELRCAYGNFGRDVVTRHGYDEPAQVRNLALNTAAGAFTKLRDNSRQVMLRAVELAPRTNA